MKCPKCGEELKDGCLYCEKCGEEIQIVPDFEPEIENSIIETLSAVAEEMSPSVEQEESVDGEDAFDSESESRGKNRIWLALTAFCVVIAGAVFVIAFRGRYQENYFELQIQNAQLEYQQKHYKEAASFYEKALKMETDISLMLSYADCLYEMGEKDQALSNYYAVIEMEPDNEMAYARIISIYEENDEYEEINKLLNASDNEKIQNEFQHYMAPAPEFNYEGGTYNRVIPLKMISATSGEIFYTLDGSEPVSGGEKYTSPIFLKSGIYHIKAVYINDFGICSDIVEAEFIVEGTQPKEPELSLPSGQYNAPQMITATAEEGCTIYYTTDGTLPDEKSFIYGEPIPMKEGVTNYRFIALSSEGVYSEVVARSYQLTVETTLTAVESVYHLKHRLLQKELILDLEGNLPNRTGKHIYVYNSLQIVEDKIMHVIYEYYQEGNNSRNMTGNVFCIDVSNGYVYKIVKDENGVEILDPV